MSDAVDLSRGYPVIGLGHGLIAIGTGKKNGLPAVIFGRNELGGRVGDELPEKGQPTGGTLAAVTFANVECLDLLLDQLRELRADLIAEKS